MVLAACARGFALQLRPYNSYASQSHPPALKHRYLDGHLPSTIQQPEGIATSRGEQQAGVCREVQMARRLNTLPQGNVQSVGQKLGQMLVLFLLNGGAQGKKGFPQCTKQCPQCI